MFLPDLLVYPLTRIWVNFYESPQLDLVQELYWLWQLISSTILHAKGGDTRVCPTLLELLFDQSRSIFRYVGIHGSYAWQPRERMQVVINPSTLDGHY